MPLFGKSNNNWSENPEVREVEKRVAKETHEDQKNLDHALGDLSKADNTHNKSIKSVDKAHHNLDKSVQKEHKTAQALDKATHRHDVAVTNAKSAEKTEQMSREYATRIEQDLEEKRQRVEDLRQQKAHNDQIRETRLSEIHAREAAIADTRSSFDAGAVPAGVEGPGIQAAASGGSGAPAGAAGAPSA
ncbi:hypothetical protein BD311DRAFT_655185 [Dichomitus squalens]|uniref:Uncharacterized protein n=1 Tax=Dichomitus squalens TaxID=114155 RepID=A0A4Q9N070_9APHY|nr:hypothetical protein BD311DRAFT_655185 [Dichomitus squalens]